MVHLQPGRSNAGMLAIASDLAERLHAGLIGIVACQDRKSTRLNSSHMPVSRMPSSA
jgi:hypothetical protein